MTTTAPARTTSAPPAGPRQAVLRRLRSLNKCKARMHARQAQRRPRAATFSARAGERLAADVTSFLQPMSASAAARGRHGGASHEATRHINTSANVINFLALPLAAMKACSGLGELVHFAMQYALIRDWQGQSVPTAEVRREQGSSWVLRSAPAARNSLCSASEPQRHSQRHDER